MNTQPLEIYFSDFLENYSGFELPKGNIQYFIISPDGFSSSLEPFEITKENFINHVKKEFEAFKACYEQQGHYSSVSGKILLTELHGYCKLQIFGE